MNQSGSLAKSRTKEKEVATMSEDTKKKEAEEEPWCPLFMDGLPKDFASNPQLAAIASLLDEDISVETKDKEHRPIKTTKNSSFIGISAPGGGKARRASRRNQSTPYPMTKQAESKTSASLGEVQLFLNMWKI